MMTHYVQRCGGLIHISNMVGPYSGQHHVHDAISFRRWKKNVDPKNINTIALAKCKPCDCGLAAGESK